MKKNDKSGKVIPIREKDIIPEEVMSALYNKLHEKTDHMFNELDYKWVMGRRVYYDVTAPLIGIIKDPECMKTLYGIPISIDMEKDNKIELWENITNKLLEDKNEAD